MAYTLPSLSYPYNALEPHIDARTMEIHHTKHHQTYIDKLNAAVSGTPFEQWPVEKLLTNLREVPEEKCMAVRNHGGGHANHSLFWTVLSPTGGGEPSGTLAEGIATAFGSFADFQKTFIDTALNRFGSGWAWLVVDQPTEASAQVGSLSILSTLNQDSPLMEGKIPILGLDVWEHAYYLMYQNRRADYVQAFWQIVNWEEVQERYMAAVG